MPIYCYYCSACGYEEEVLRRMGDVDCPDCVNCGTPMGRNYRKEFPKLWILKGEGGYPSRVKQIRNTTYRKHPKLEHEPNRTY